MNGEALIEGIHKKMHEMQMHQPSRQEPLAWLVLTPRQVRELRMVSAQWWLYAPHGEKFMGMPLVVLTKKVPLHNWLMASACIDMRGDDDE